MVNALLCCAALDKALKITPITPALKAGMGFFGCMTVASKQLADDLILGERIVVTRLHRDILGISTLHTVYSLPVWLMRRLIVGKSESRSSIVFMRAFQEFAVRRRLNATAALA